MLSTQIQLVKNASMAADVVSPIQQLIQMFGYAAQANYATSGSLGGVLSLEASVDHEQDSQGNVINAGNFVTIANSSVTLTGAGSYIWNFSGCQYPYFRVRYTHAGGDSGTLNVWCNIKGI